MATYTRQNVWDAGGKDGWGDTVLWYARGVQAMKDKRTDGLDNRVGWRFFGGMHDFIAANWQRVKYYTPGETMPKGNDLATFWHQCQHGSWYFLPWHRGYLLALEDVVRAAVVKAGRPGGLGAALLELFRRRPGRPAAGLRLARLARRQGRQPALHAVPLRPRRPRRQRRRQGLGADRRQRRYARRHELHRLHQPGRQRARGLRRHPDQLHQSRRQPWRHREPSARRRARAGGRRLERPPRRG